MFMLSKDRSGYQMLKFLVVILCGAVIFVWTHHTYEEDDKIIVKIENIRPTPEHVDTNQIT